MGCSFASSGFRYRVVGWVYFILYAGWHQKSWIDFKIMDNYDISSNFFFRAYLVVFGSLEIHLDSRVASYF